MTVAGYVPQQRKVSQCFCDAPHTLRPSRHQYDHGKKYVYPIATVGEWNFMWEVEFM